MGQCLSSVSSLYILTISFSLTALTLGADYHLYLSNTTDTSLKCSSATSTDSCFLHCDTAQNTYIKHTFDCGNSGHCEFLCTHNACAQYSTINAKNVAQDLTITSSGTECMRYATVYLPNEGDATLTNNHGSYLLGTTITAGTNTHHITVHCIKDCIATVINAQNAQYLNLTVDTSFKGDKKILKTVEAILNCPQNSDYDTASCVIDLKNSASMEYSTINTIYGIPKDLSINTGHSMNYVTITCSAYDGESLISSNNDIYTGDCYIESGSTTSKPTLRSTVEPTVKVLTPTPTTRPTFIIEPTPKATVTTQRPTPKSTVTTQRPSDRDILVCDDERTGSFSTEAMFTVRMESDGELLFIVETSATLQSLLASDGVIIVAKDGNLDGKLEIMVDKGDYVFTVNVGDGVYSTFYVYILCETDVNTPSPTAKSTTTTTMGMLTETDVFVSDFNDWPWPSFDDGIFASDVDAEIVPPVDTAKDKFLNNLGFVVIAMLAFPLCVFAVVSVWKRAKKRKSEEWVALV